MKPSLTIGIAAYNEEKNISVLLSQLLGQKIISAMMTRIIVVDDGSSDATTLMARKVNNDYIQVVSHNDRKGKSTRLNEICDIAHSDILVLLDADITIQNDNFVDALIAPIQEKKAELCSCIVKELPTRTFLGSVLVASMEFKRNLFLKLSSGNNIYTCHGRARALSKNMYKKLDFNKYIADDAYTYLFAKKNGHPYTYVTSTELYYKIPETLSDHLKQSARFFSTQREFYEEFGEKTVLNEYGIPTSMLITGLISNLVQHPLQIASYLVVTIISLLYSKGIKVTWGTAHSTK